MPRTKKVDKQDSTDKVINKEIKSRINIIKAALGESGLTIVDAEREAKTPRISMGILGLDEATSGGLMEGKVAEFFGEEQSGKSLTALLAIAEAQRQGKYCVYFDVEYGFDSEWAHKLGVNTDPGYFAIPDIAVDDTVSSEDTEILTAEKVFDSICKLAKTKAVGLIVVDSIAAMIPAEEYEGEIEDQKYASLAKVVKKGLSRAIPLLAKSGTSLILINQVRDDIGSYVKSVHTPGGRALRHLVSTKIMFKKGGVANQLKDGDTVNGVDILCKVTKHRGGPNFRSATFRLWYDKGFDSEFDLVTYLISKGKITQEGSVYTFGDTKVRGLDSLIGLLKDDNVFYEKTFAAAKEIILNANSMAIVEAERIEQALADTEEKEIKE